MRRSSLLALLLGLTIPAALAAQEPAAAPQPRTGFWISFGPSGGPHWFSCDVCTDSELGRGFGGQLALGGTVNQQWLIGAEFVGWFPFSGMDDGYDDNSDGFGAALASARFYPRPQRNLFLTGGVGIGEIDEEADLLEATGYVVKAGAGVDLRVGRNFSITPTLSLIQTFATETERAGDPLEGSMNFGMLQLAFSATWH